MKPLGAFEVFRASDDARMNSVLVIVSAEVFLVCAVVLLLFAYLQLPLELSTAIAIIALFAGSLFCWKSYAAAQTILLISILVTEFVMLRYIDWLLLPFVLIDIAVLYSIVKNYQS